jgi:hypothetical protein
MPKFLVNVGRLVREHTTVSVEAPSADVVEQNMKLLFAEVEMTEPTWEPDDDWGTEMSDSNNVDELESTEQVDFTMTEDGDITDVRNKREPDEP